MTFVGTNILQGKGGELNLLPMAPTASFISDSSFLP